MNTTVNKKKHFKDFVKKCNVINQFIKVFKKSIVFQPSGRNKINNKIKHFSRLIIATSDGCANYGELKKDQFRATNST